MPKQQRVEKKTNFSKEIRNLMFGFGDVHDPMQESVEVLEELLEWFIIDLCERSRSRAIGMKLKTSDFLQALEGDGKKLARAHELLNLDKILKNARSTFGDTIPTEF